jgi:hypothetical protein
MLSVTASLWEPSELLVTSVMDFLDGHKRWVRLDSLGMNRDPSSCAMYWASSSQQDVWERIYDFIAIERRGSGLLHYLSWES